MAANLKFVHRDPSISLGTTMATRLLFAFIALFVSNVGVHAGEVIPPKPAGYFNDYAGVVSKDAALRLNEQLAQFERDTSNQVVVAVFPNFPSQSSVQDFAQRTFQAWGVGQKDKRNGAILFVFVQDHKMWIQTGYGLEGALPDATCADIIRNVIAPHFKTGDYEKGLAAGINAIISAARGEYKGGGRTDLESRGGSKSWTPLIVVLIILAIVTIASRRQRRRGYRYSSVGGPFIGGWGGGGGGWSGGSSSGGGFSGFSGGGGSSGGGGAGGSW